MTYKKLETINGAYNYNFYNNDILIASYVSGLLITCVELSEEEENYIDGIVEVWKMRRLKTFLECVAFGLVVNMPLWYYLYSYIR